MTDKAQIFTITIDSIEPTISGAVSASINGQSAKFTDINGLTEFIKAKFTAQPCCENATTQPITDRQQPAVETVKTDDKKHIDYSKRENRPEKKKIIMPPRAEIKEALKKISNFTDDELSIMGWSSCYKAYSLMVRYGQTGVEEEFRKNNWFQKELKKIEIERKKAEKKDKTKKREQKEAKKQEKEERRIAKELERENRKRAREDKKKFKKSRDNQPAVDTVTDTKNDDKAKRRAEKEQRRLEKEKRRAEKAAKRQEKENK